MVTKLRYGNTNTFLVRGSRGNILIDTDYAGTLTAYINEEFARVKAEEAGIKGRSAQESAQENVAENVVENVVVNLPLDAQKLIDGYSRRKASVAVKLIGIIEDNNTVTIAEMAKKTGVTERTVQRYLKDFQDAYVIRREGSDKSGKWLLL